MRHNVEGLCVVVAFIERQATTKHKSPIELQRFNPCSSATITQNPML